MLDTHAAERAFTGAAEMSVFHGLSAGNVGHDPPDGGVAVVMGATVVEVGATVVVGVGAVAVVGAVVVVLGTLVVVVVLGWRVADAAWSTLSLDA
jgi:hypothetical protein